VVVAAPPPRRPFPFGFAALLVATLLLYAVTTATVLESRSSDAAGNALSQAFAAILGGLLWIAIIVLLAMARARGAMVRWAPWALFVLVPASVVAYFIAIGRFEPGGGPARVVVFALPPLAVLFAAWARFSDGHNTLRPAGTSSGLLALMAVLSFGMIAIAVGGELPGPKAKAERAAAEKVRLEQEARARRDQQERESAAFARLGPDSHIADYLPFLHNQAFADQAMQGIQKVKTRQADATALIEQRSLNELTELWQWNLLGTREMCEAYANAFLRAANRIDKSRGDYLSAAMDLEWQMPNLKWIVGSKCDLSGPLERAETNIKAVTDSDRLRNFAVTLGELKKAR
jgi:hypothetical protein